MKPDDVPGPPIVLPRPNPGPEPWPEGVNPLLGWLSLAFAPVVLIVAWRFRRARRSRPRPPDASSSAMEGSPTVPARDRLLGLAQAGREAMADRLGPTWGAMTTEEIAGSISGVDPAARTAALHLLDAADRVKFAGFEIEPGYFARAEAWAAEALAGLRPEGARSTRNGR